MTKKLLVFLGAVGISLVGAMHRWDDSAHAIGLIKADGGSVRHRVTLPGGEDRYVLIATATVLPPYRGDARVELRGEPEIPVEMEAAGPVIDLGLRHAPRFRDNTFSGLEPGDRVALWVKMMPPRADPVCGMACQEGFARVEREGKSYCFCSDGCSRAFANDPGMYRDRDFVRGSYRLTFTDTTSGRQVLEVPITFAGKEGADNGHEHVH